MNSFKLVIQYDGTNYFGWQRQTDVPTVQGEIEKALFKIYKEKINIIGAGRTDAGVHALNQVASFSTDKELDTKVITKALNSNIPKDIRIISTSTQGKDFHARFSAKQREYKYIIYSGDFCPPFRRRYVLFTGRIIDCERLNSALYPFMGEHDFSSFTSHNEPSSNRKRRIYDIKASKHDNEIVIVIRANAFLRKMVRMIVGTSLYLTFKEHINVSDEIKRLLLLKNRKLNKYPTVSPKGLFLNRIFY